MTLSVAADGVRLVTNRSPGKVRHSDGVIGLQYCIALEATPLLLVDAVVRHGECGCACLGICSGRRLTPPVPLISLLPRTALTHVLLLLLTLLPQITGAAVCRFAGTSCGGFEAVAARGYIYVNITNTGRLDSDYTLTGGTGWVGGWVGGA